MLLSQRLTSIAKLAFSAGMTPEWSASCFGGSGLPRDVRHWLEAPDIRANNEQRRNPQGKDADRYGAAADSLFQHLAVEVPGKGGKAEWLEPVDDEACGKLP